MVAEEFVFFNLHCVTNSCKFEGFRVFIIYLFQKLPLKMLKKCKQWGSSVSISCFSQHDIAVVRLPGNNVPNRSPQSYSNDEILNGIDGLYIAVRRPDAPKSEDIVTIGNSVNSKRKRRNLAGKLW